jgi:hypothetical protein
VSELWTCPECGHRFRWRNQSHSCTTYTVEDHLRGKPPAVVRLYRAFEAAALAVGPDVEPEAVKAWISFRARMRFAGLAVQQRGLRCHVVLRRDLPHPRFVRIESIRTQHVHSFRIDRLEDVDDDLRACAALGAEELVPLFALDDEFSAAPSRRRTASRSAGGARRPRRGAHAPR